jgi:putative ABC transport system permease protein
MRSTYTLSWRNLKQHPTRVTLSALGVALGVAMVVAADTIGAAVRSAGARVAQNQSTAGIVAAQLEAALGAVGLVILAAAGFVVFNAFAMSVAQRRHQIGALRSLGMTRRQVMALVLVEALITGGAGTVLGLVAGPLLGRGLVALLGETAGIAHTQGRPSLGGLALAGALGLGITLLSVLFPACMAARVSPLVALRGGTRSKKPGFQEKTRFLGWALIIVLALYLSLAPPAHWIEPPWDNRLTALFALAWLAGLALVLPALVGNLGRWARGPLSRLGGATGRLAADNLGRERRRVTLTVLTLASGLTMIVSVTGFLHLTFPATVRHFFRGHVSPHTWIALPFNVGGGWASWEMISELDLSTAHLTPQLERDLGDTLGGRATTMGAMARIIPQIAVVPGSFSFFVDASQVQRLDLFAFYAGDWARALPIMESGCGLLLTPGVAHRNGVWVYDTLALPGVEGPVPCTVAGLGNYVGFGVSVVSVAAARDFGLDPLGGRMVRFVQPLPDVDVDAFEADLADLAARHPEATLMDLDTTLEDLDELVEIFLTLLNGPLLLAILAAALGVVNTVMMSVSERRRELGLLRAVGTTRGQALAVVAGEAALMGLAGGALGLLAGAGLVVIRALVGGHHGLGISDLSPWSSAWAALRPALRNGLVGLVAAPLVCAGVACLPVRASLRSAVVEMVRKT